MTRLPWRAEGARLHLPRDLEVAFTIGRMGVATSAQVGPLYYAAHNTARYGFLRLLRLGLLRTFERRDVSSPAWFALRREAAPFVAERFDCSEDELRVVTGILRTNLPALEMRNRLWVALALGCRASAGRVALGLFRPEWELRRMKAREVAVVPDALAVLVEGRAGGEVEHVWMIELDGGTERSAIWKEKAGAYAALRSRGLLYGAERWNVLAVVPSIRRGRTIAAAVTEAGAGAFTYLVEEGAISGGPALSAPLWRAADLAVAPGTASVPYPLARTVTGIPDQPGQSTAERLVATDSRESVAG